MTMRAMRQPSLPSSPSHGDSRTGFLHKLENGEARLVMVEAKLVVGALEAVLDGPTVPLDVDEGFDGGSGRTPCGEDGPLAAGDVKPWLNFRRRAVPLATRAREKACALAAQ